MAYRRTERVLQRLAARHDDIVAAACALAGELGMGAVQIIPVAERAGIAAGTVYRYFPSKTDLVAALVTAVCEREMTALRRAADAAPGPLSALTAAITTFAAHALRNRRRAWAVMAEPVETEVDAVRLFHRQALAAEFERRIRAALVAGLLPQQDARTGAAVLVGALMESLIGPLAPDLSDPGKQKEAVQASALLALRALGIIDARARGLVVQTAWPAENDDA